MGLRSGPIHRGIREDRGAVVDGRYAKNWMARRTERAEVHLPPFFNRSGKRLAFRQTVDASRALVDDLTPVRLLKAHEASA